MLGGEFMTLHKIFPLGNGGFIAGAGYYDQIVEIADWMSNGCNPETRPSLPESDGSTLLVVDENGKVYWLTWPYLRPIPIEEPFIAIGSGSAYAMGAMAAGASAERAIAIAVEFDPNTGKGIQVVRCGPKAKKTRKKKE
jgi:hypothetical protein